MALAPGAIPPLYARLKIMRLAAARMAYVGPLPIGINIGYTNRTRNVRFAGATVTDDLNHAPNTAHFRVQGIVPLQGQQVQIYVGPFDVAHRVFSGIILAIRTGYEGVPRHVAYDCECIDFTWFLSKRTALARYVGLSATSILVDLITRFSTSAYNGVMPGLPVINEITFTNEDLPAAISRVMVLIGGYWYVDGDNNVTAFLGEPNVPAVPITQTLPNTMADIAYATDLSQIATRVVVRGGGSSLAADLGPGQSTLPLQVNEGESWYAPGGGVVEVGPQRMTYTQVIEGGIGSTVAGKPTAAPSPPVATAVVTAGNLVGTYSYRVAFLISGAESPSSAPSNAIQVPAALPASTIMASMNYGGKIPGGTVSRYRITFIDGAGVEGLAMESALFTMPNYPYNTDPNSGIYGFPYGGKWDGAGVPIGPAGTTDRKIYRSDNGAAYRFYAAYGNNTGTTFGDVTPYGELGGAMPNIGLAATPGRATVANIEIGPAGTTARRLYRTGGRDAEYRLVVSLNDNTTTTYADNIADAARGVLGNPEGTIGVAVGDVTIQVANLAAFPDAGWVTVGNQLIQYFSRTAPSGIGSLRDIPATGTGAITAPISVGTEVVTLPQLICTGGLVHPVASGAPVNIIAQADDAAAQAALADIEQGGDGIHEYFLSDGRWGLAECQARATGELGQRKDPLVTVTFTTRDPSVQSGRTIAINLTSPAITGTFRIQRVTIDLSEAGPVLPLRFVEASSRRYALEDLLRLIRGTD